MGSGATASAQTTGDGPPVVDGLAPARSASDAAAAETAAAPVQAVPPQPVEGEALDLMEVAGGSSARALVPVAAGAVVLALIIWLVGRR